MLTEDSIYTFIDHYTFSSFRKHLGIIPTIGASFVEPRVYDQISAQIFGLPLHIYFTDNHILSVLVYACIVSE